MRRGRTLLLGLLTGLLAGCATDPAARQPTNWLARLHPFQGASAADAVQLDVALIEQRPGDPFLSEEGLWAEVDESALVDYRTTLKNNGFLAGQVSGIMPDRLLDLMKSNRSCVNPRRSWIRAGKSTTLRLGPVLPQCRFEVWQRGEQETVTLDMAECELLVVPSLTDDGRTRLRLTPQVRHGETVVVFRPTPDRSGWVWQPQQPTETYTDLSWEVDLRPNEYLLVGGRFNQPNTLGHQCFVRSDEPRPVQRLLVIRTCRLLPGVSAETDEEEQPANSAAPPLAAQAQVGAFAVREK